MRNASSTDDSLLTQARRKIEDGQALLLDVREQDEWDREHLTVAIWIPMSQLRDETQRADALQESRPAAADALRQGRAPRMCAEMLQKLGYDAVPLTVAYDDLVAAVSGNSVAGHAHFRSNFWKYKHDAPASGL